MNLHVVAYPEIRHADRERIQACRRDQNSLYHVIDPHFTIVFSVPDMGQEEFIDEIRSRSADSRAIKFSLKCAVINKDSFSDYYDVFLVPDEGHAEIVKLHDRLYAGKLASHHLLDVSYIPHLSIANSLDVRVVKRIVDEWNAKDFAIEGVISTLDVINYDRAKREITTIERIRLSGAASERLA